MIRYWFKFNNNGHLPMGTQLGIGVTANDYNDALLLIRSRVFKNDKLPEIEECIKNVQVNSLDRDHVIPNMGIPSIRGIWFPLGYS